MPFINYLSRMKYILAVFIFFLFFSCTPDVCNQKVTWPAQASFYKISTLSKDSLVFVDSVSIWGLNNSILLYKNLKVNKVELPLSINSDNSIFVIKIKSKHDTLKFYCSNTSYFISKQCCCGYQQVIDSVTSTKHVISKITWKLPQVDKNDKENVEIYY